MKSHPFAPGTIEAAKLRTQRAERLAFRTIMVCLGVALMAVSAAAAGYIDLPAVLMGVR